MYIDPSQFLDFRTWPRLSDQLSGIKAHNHNGVRYACRQIFENTTQKWSLKAAIQLFLQFTGKRLQIIFITFWLAARKNKDVRPAFASDEQAALIKGSQSDFVDPSHDADTSEVQFTTIPRLYEALIR